MAIRTKYFALPLLLCMALSTLTGCGPAPEVDTMKSGLIRSGMDAGQAACFAEQMSETVDGDPYNYMAKLMNAGLSEREAVNKARRKYGADFKSPMQKARAACVE